MKFATVNGSYCRVLHCVGTDQNYDAPDETSTGSVLTEAMSAHGSDLLEASMIGMQDDLHVRSTDDATKTLYASVADLGLGV